MTAHLAKIMKAMMRQSTQEEAMIYSYVSDLKS